MVNNEKWTIKLSGGQSTLVTTGWGSEVDDLDKIARTLGTTKWSLLGGNVIKDIRIERIRTWTENWIRAIQFSYKVETDNMSYSIEGDKQGGNGGTERTINLEADEYIISINGKRGGCTDQLRFVTYIPSRKQTKSYGAYGNETRRFNLSPTAGSVHVCFFGKCNRNNAPPGQLNALTGFGMYEGKIFSSQQCAIPEHQQLQDQNAQLQNQITQQQQTITSLNSNNSQLQSQLATSQQQNQSLQTQLEQTKKDKDQLTQKIKDKDQEIAKLNQQLEEHKQCQVEKDKLQQQIVELTKKVEDLETIIGIQAKFEQPTK